MVRYGVILRAMPVLIEKVIIESSMATIGFKKSELYIRLLMNRDRQAASILLRQKRLPGQVILAWFFFKYYNVPKSETKTEPVATTNKIYIIGHVLMPIRNNNRNIDISWLGSSHNVLSWILFRWFFFWLFVCHPLFWLDRWY